MQSYQTLTTDLKEAMKAGETEKRDTLRLLQSALKNFAIEKRVSAEELSGSDIESVIKKLVKQRKDSIEQYQAGGRADLVAKEQSELGILTAYLPEELSDEALLTIIGEVLQEGGFVGTADLGKATGAVMKKTAGAASGERVRKLLLGQLKD